MNEESKVKLAWSLREELKKLDRKHRDIILREIAILVDRRIKFFIDYEKLKKENSRIVAAEPLYITRSE